MISSVKHFFNAAAKVAGILLFRFFLIIPLAYIMFALIITAAFGARVGDYIYYIAAALVLCCVLSVLLTIRRNFTDRGKGAETQRKLRRRIGEARTLNEDGSAGIVEASADVHSDDSLSDGKALDSRNERLNDLRKSEPAPKPRLYTKSLSNADGADDFSAPRVSDGIKPAAENPLIEKRITGASNPPPEQAYVTPDSIGGRKPLPEWPKYLRTKRDPNLILLEYPDRLEIYKKTINGLEYQSTEYKQ